MGAQRDRYERWVNDRFKGKRDPGDERAILAAADAVDAILEGGPVSAETLAPLMTAAAHPRQMQWDNATNLLARITDRPEVIAAIAGLAGHPKAHARFAAICVLCRATRSPAVVGLVRSGLTDASANVRWKAAEAAERLGSADLVPAVSRALGVEKNDRARRSIALSLGLLRDGHVLRQVDEDRVSVTVPLPYPGLITTRAVTAATIERRGIAAVVRDIAAGRDVK